MYTLTAQCAHPLAVSKNFSLPLAALTSQVLRCSIQTGCWADLLPVVYNSKLRLTISLNGILCGLSASHGLFVGLRQA